MHLHHRSTYQVDGFAPVFMAKGVAVRGTGVGGLLGTGGLCRNPMECAPDSATSSSSVYPLPRNRQASCGEHAQRGCQRRWRVPPAQLPSKQTGSCGGTQARRQAIACWLRGACSPGQSPGCDRAGRLRCRALWPWWTGAGCRRGQRSAPATVRLSAGRWRSPPQRPPAGRCLHRRWLCRQGPAHGGQGKAGSDIWRGFKAARKARVAAHAPPVTVMPRAHLRVGCQPGVDGPSPVFDQAPRILHGADGGGQLQADRTIGSARLLCPVKRGGAREAWVRALGRDVGAGRLPPRRPALAHRSNVPASWNARRSRAPSGAAWLGLPGWPTPGAGGAPGPAAADPPVITAQATSLTLWSTAP